MLIGLVPPGCLIDFWRNDQWQCTYAILFSSLNSLTSSLISLSHTEEWWDDVFLIRSYSFSEQQTLFVPVPGLDDVSLLSMRGHNVLWRVYMISETGRRSFILSITLQLALYLKRKKKKVLNKFVDLHKHLDNYTLNLCVSKKNIYSAQIKICFCCT